MHNKERKEKEKGKMIDVSILMNHKTKKNNEEEGVSFTTSTRCYHPFMHITIPSGFVDIS